MTLFGSRYHEEHVAERRQRSERAASASTYRAALERIMVSPPDQARTIAATALDDTHEGQRDSRG